MTFKLNFPLKETAALEMKAAEKGLPGSIWETYSAFCNTQGGTIVLGISEDPVTRELVCTGVKNADSIIRNFWNTVNNPQKVSYVALTDNNVRAENADGKVIVVIEVPRVDRRNRPVFINNNLNSGTFRRNFECDYHCTLSEIKEMIRDSEPNTSDKLVLENMNSDVLALDTLTSYRDSLRAYKGGHPWLKLDDEEFMTVIGAAGYGADGKLHPTRAGLLMFGKEYRITDEYPNYFLDYREKRGDERWSYRLQSQSGEWSGNLFDFFTAAAGRLSAFVISPFELNGLARKGDSGAFVAVREALMNALIHSDYNVERGVVAVLSPDALTVSNPGTFRIPLSDAVKGGVSDPRNGQIMKMFSLIGLVEHIGSGLYTIIESERNGAIADVRIEEAYEPSRVTIVLDLSPGTAKDNSVSKVMDALRSNSSATVAMIAETIGLSEKTVSRALAELKFMGKIERVGSKKFGYWEFKNHSLK